MDDSLPMPAWFTALDRARLDQVIERTRAPFVDDTSRGLLVMRRSYGSDAEAVAAVLAVFEWFVEALIRTRARATEDLTIPADQFLDACIVWANRRPSGPVTLDDFAAMVRTALETQPWWQTLQTMIKTSTVQPPTTAEQLRALLKETGLTFGELAEAMDMDKTDVTDHLHDKVTPGPTKARA